MKRFISVLSSLLVLPAFAEVAPVYYDEVIEYSDDMNSVEEKAQSEVATQKTVTPRPVSSRSSSTSRAVASGTNVTSRANTSSRAVASSPRTATSGTTRGTVARSTRTAANNSRATVSPRNARTTKSTAARVSMLSNVDIMSGSRLSGNPMVLTSDKTLYNSNASVTAPGSSRVGVANRRASSRLSTVSAPATNTTTKLTQEEVTATTDNLAAIAELTDYCKAQYMACMDNYCNVLDDNQGRCSCSKNIKNYEKTENALAQATEDFQNVVQQIRYIGLTTDQVEALFTETEAELTMKSTTDSSRLKNSLDSIKKKILDVSTPSASSTAVTNGLTLDLNGLLTADFTAGFDLNSFLNMNKQSTESVSNQRGDQLYKTAATRCKTAVLNSCTAQGIDANVITNAYDLEIDKQCVLYERSLTDANAEMRQNATNATTILQQARLLLAQNKNSYDFRGCIAAIDSCMQDEYVCGNDYELCLDPTGKYIAEGEVIKGGTPGVSGGQNRTKDVLCEETDTNGCKSLSEWTSGGMYHLYSTWDYNSNKYNAWSIGQNENLGRYVDEHLNTWKSKYKTEKDQTQSEYMAMYLLQKIGYIDDNDKPHGMCASVMKQCQDYTYSKTSSRKSTRKYKPDNEVIRQYLNTVLPKIKVQQDAIIADYAESCRADVQSCLSTNGYDESNTDATVSYTAVNACASEITTCMSVGGYQITEGAKITLRAMSNWVKSLMITCGENEFVYDNGKTTECRQCPTALVFVDANLLSFNIDGISVTNPNKPYYPVSYGRFNNNPSEPQYNIVSGYDGAVAVPMISSGGHVTSCSCPEGYTHTTVAALSHMRGSGSDAYEEFYDVYEEDDDLKSFKHHGEDVCIDTSVVCKYYPQATTNNSKIKCGTAVDEGNGNNGGDVGEGGDGGDGGEGGDGGVTP